MQLIRLAFWTFLSCIVFASSPAAWALSRSSEDHSPPTGVISLSALPPEARTTLRLIQKGGPFPHRRDGVEFQNREHRLPVRPRGYYREYTVPTPGSSDRGARRIVAGRYNEFYYTGDHYRSFRRIQP